MVADPKLIYMTPEEYLDWEEEQPLKYGYIDGEIYDMTGGTLPHNEIAVNLTTSLKTYLRGKGCKVFMADAKVGVSEKGPFHYPDVIVTCDPRDQKARRVIYHPCLIVEVLSPSTEAFDRGDKFKHYRQISTLKEYVLISADKINVDCYRLNENNKWELTSYSLDEMNLSPEEIEIEFTSINYSCPLSSMYEDVALGEEDN
ncbi:hypothetical protein C7H19_10020 [Aphanothece hegewaldii CCALA 016]|uniref:Putative restriction endonuclease domain-containing protein n=1 Tax=Aphanothece hegewaldii CCALA 016 TaxID=2107694 RepID=A0A2T1LYM7_9CHRO|nr:Uma2 family endonuclease [Aphanothece hegewaldii]PSF37495.1 hypothetical protein C7H19_10020 [Aphanothece hegewaldii CCALA 016]